jgi:hypothetical protein
VKRACCVKRVLREARAKRACGASGRPLTSATTPHRAACVHGLRMGRSRPLLPLCRATCPSHWLRERVCVRDPLAAALEPRWRRNCAAQMRACAHRGWGAACVLRACCNVSRVGGGPHTTPLLACCKPRPPALCGCALCGSTPRCSARTQRMQHTRVTSHASDACSSLRCGQATHTLGCSAHSCAYMCSRAHTRARTHPSTHASVGSLRWEGLCCSVARSCAHVCSRAHVRMMRGVALP